MAILEELQQAVARVQEGTAPSVVGVGNGWRGGSGIVVADGRVLTNAHNVHGDEVTVVFADGRRARGQVVGADHDGDLAAIAVETQGARALEWAPSAPGVGSAVFALAASSSGTARVTFGLVSAVARAFSGPRGKRITGSIEHTAPLSPGSSGGPIVDAEGRLLGINTNRLGNGFYLALPADETLRGRVEALGRGEVPEPRRLGVALAPPHVARRMRQAVGLPEQDGVLVRGVADDSPAARAGLQEGDLIVVAAGQAIRSVDDLQAILDRPDQAGTLELRLVRGTEERSVTVAW